MGEAERIRFLRLSINSECPWCGQPVGDECMTPDGVAMWNVHPQRQSRWYAEGQPGLGVS